ncbi:6,7-dimethyl-8-ribityllumazine synthase [Aestuariispira ectoiniformans]|uniref:6,7-dimethyl-8-ribityllumazine synthase n=1 Tax=Aestuariispira ectoiniformans TaxID=2775080 RepID=UPI00223B9C24|nr:6,7-dimethyl-8-ribityllumazine synthase [Aestuariispira ectoiniformans]
MNQISSNSPKNLKVAFIQAQWHADIVGNSREAFLSAIVEKTGNGATVDIIDVPGAFEIPLQAKRLAQTSQYDAIVGAAFVVDGGIYRHDFVAQAVIQGLMQVQLETGTPVLSAVLTPHHFHETDEHRRFFQDHFRIKGREAADACLAITAMPSVKAAA